MGAVATWHVCAIAGGFFSIIARIPFGLAVKISAAQLTPYLIIGAITSFVISHVFSKNAKKQTSDNPYFKYAVPLEYQAGWEACNIRNLSGYASIGIGGANLSVVMIAARAGLFVL